MCTALHLSLTWVKFQHIVDKNCVIYDTLQWKKIMCSNVYNRFPVFRYLKQVCFCCCCFFGGGGWSLQLAKRFQNHFYEKNWVIFEPSVVPLKGFLCWYLYRIWSVGHFVVGSWRRWEMFLSSVITLLHHCLHLQVQQ